MDAIVSRQLPLLKYTVAKLFAITTVSVLLYYIVLYFRVSYPLISQLQSHRLEQDSYFVVTNFFTLILFILIGCLLTAIYLLLPQLNQISGTLVFCLIAIGTAFMLWADTFGINNLQTLFSDTSLQNHYSLVSTLSTLFLASGFVLLLAHSIYDIFIKKN